MKRLRDRDLFKRLSSVAVNNNQYSWAQNIMCTELRRLGRVVRKMPPDGRKKSNKVEFVRIYYDAKTNTLHQNQGNDAEFNRLYGWVYKKKKKTTRS